MKKYLASILLIGTLICPAFADLEPWVDSWNNFSYYETNGERKNFQSFILRSETKVGVKLLEDSLLNPYLAYYGVYSQDENYWNNNLAAGVGVRALPFLKYQTTNWMNEWIPDVKFFVEILSLTFLKNRISAEAIGVKVNDTRFGIDIWHEWNLKKPDPAYPWAESWLNLSYRDTNFYQEKFATYLLFWRSKLGGYMGAGICPYLVADLMYSGRPEAWFNNLYYGVGLRIEPFLGAKDTPEILRKFKMFAEMLGIAWLREADSRPGNDLRFGVEFTIGR